jgi:hypothetical protein
MKTLLLVLAIGMLALAGISAEPAAKITFGTSHQKVFPAADSSPRMVYIELPVTITNTSTAAIRFGTNMGPQFNEYVQRKTTSKHWSDITPRGMCGVGYSVHQLAPGAALDSTMLIQLQYGGHGYRLDLPIFGPDSNQMSRIKIKSEAIVLPKIKG